MLDAIGTSESDGQTDASRMIDESDRSRRITRPGRGVIGQHTGHLITDGATQHHVRNPVLVGIDPLRSYPTGHRVRR